MLDLYIHQCVCVCVLCVTLVYWIHPAILDVEMCR
jgi:hypothetical protein